jgi:1-acyl-sn-glycerol-3-phosphate acyltransferase
MAMKDQPTREDIARPTGSSTTGGKVEMSRVVPYPRRIVIRRLLRFLIRAAFPVLANFEVEGRENIPKSGPLLVVGNHFSFIDPVAMIHATPWPLDFVGAVERPNAPWITRWIPYLWGYVMIRRGTGGLQGMRKAESVLKQNGVLGIFPEAGSWAKVLRPARPGTAYLAARTHAPILPLGMIGMEDLFPTLRRGKRPTVKVRVGEIFGPFITTGRGKERREQLDEIGHAIMRKIADLIPPAKRGYYSDDPAIREAARGTEIYPWDGLSG